MQNNGCSRWPWGCPAAEESLYIHINALIYHLVHALGCFYVELSRRVFFCRSILKATTFQDSHDSLKFRRQLRILRVCGGVVQGVVGGR